jgi:hypothetical protein
VRDVGEHPRSYQVLVLVVRKDLVGGELAAVEKVVLVAKARAVLGMLRGRQEDKTEVSTVLATGSMEADVTLARRQRREKHRGWILGRCSGLRVLKGEIVGVVVRSEWVVGVLLCCLKSAASLGGISDQTWNA